ncbi:hypothetical protein CC80DRAFT_594587 [Byssothecium circinans]|uniref:Peptidase S8/S53 domain-containing protein n=1 Tax=Byssothecium circinans TaxID=147558 RepID=A0A6A5TT64_9PLEO|nr:hypothetical protein CC80DRAFT_594587 [Byssothecium circinans]
MSRSNRAVLTKPLLKVRSSPDSIVWKGQEARRTVWLVKRLSLEYPQLLEEIDRQGNGALFLAIQNQMQWFVDAVLDSGISKIALQKLLGPVNETEEKTKNKSNCIFALLKTNGITAATTIRIIEAASEYTLSAQDEDGFTPLHHAAQYSKCRPKKLGIITALIGGGDGAFDKHTRKNHFSVYQQHIHTKQRNEDRKKRSSRAQRGNFGSTKWQPSHPVMQQASASDMKARGPQLRTSTDDERSKWFAEDNKYLSKIMEQTSSTTATEIGANEKTAKIVADEKILEETADYVAKQLKLHYFRSTFRQWSAATPSHSNQTQPRLRTHDSALNFLSQNVTEQPAIYFDLSASSKADEQTINFKTFKKSFDGVVFDPVLLFAKFGQLEIEPQDLGPREANRRKLDGPGRRDMLQFFQWLYDKGVRNIIKVIVEDGATHEASPVAREILPHSDEVIVQALTRFEIEILDWRKVPLDSMKCLEKNFEEFVQRLNNNRAEIGYGSIAVKHHSFDSRISDRYYNARLRNTEASGPSKRIDEHKWLTVMDKFSEAIHQLKRLNWFPQEYLNHKTLPSALKKPITVALIDDGVNFMHEAISENVGQGKSFGNSDEGEIAGVPQPYHGSTTGHGTLMAYMIRRICPGVKIFVCKLDMKRTESGKEYFTGESAAAAADHVSKHDFDVISMSWSIVRNDSGYSNNTEALTKLQSALLAASHKSLLFCSSPDIGAATSANTYYPFGCPEIKKMFKIGAAKADGTRYGWSGNECDFILPGENVEVKENHHMICSDELDMVSTGSSVATALAAGLAALILHCVRLGAIYNVHSVNRAGFGSQGTLENGVREQTLRVIKHHEAMHKAFVTIAGWKDSGYSENDRRLGVESFFTKPGKDVGEDSELNLEQKWAKIASIARDLVSDNMESKFSK